MKRLPLITSFVLFLALCATVTYWTMQVLHPRLRAVAAPPQVAQTAPPLDAAAGLFGGGNYSAASNVQLKGVVVAGNPAESVAILSVDGKPAQAIRVNREVMPGATLTEVQKDHVLMSQGGVIKRVDLPANAAKRSSPMAAPAMIVTPIPQPVIQPPQRPNRGSPGGGKNRRNQNGRRAPPTSR